MGEINDDVNVDDNRYPLRTTCSSPFQGDSAESTKYGTNKKELSCMRALKKCFVLGNPLD